jgi:hypothetical protein
MHIVRMVVWVLLLTALLVFSFANWDPTVTVKIWTNLVVETKIPAVVIISFLVGFVPMWLLYRASRWQHTRRINTLEATARSVAIAPAPVIERDPVVTSPEHPAPVAAEVRRDPPPGL